MGKVKGKSRGQEGRQRKEHKVAVISLGGVFLIAFRGEGAEGKKEGEAGTRRGPAPRVSPLRICGVLEESAEKWGQASKTRGGNESKGGGGKG